MRKRLLGEDHPNVANSLNNLASLYKSQGRFSEAEPLYQQALAMSKKFLGEEHPDTKIAKDNLRILTEEMTTTSETKADSK
jgi:tetratricopeptide (TPR) repeat protein